MKFGEIEVFEDKTFEDLLKDIYVNSTEKSKEYKLVLERLIEMVKTSTDAVLLMPLIADYSKIAVTNDDHLIKLATVVQKFYSKIKTGSGNQNKSGELIITSEDRELLLRDLHLLKDTPYIELPATLPGEGK